MCKSIFVTLHSKGSNVRYTFPISLFIVLPSLADCDILLNCTLPYSFSSSRLGGTKLAGKLEGMFIELVISPRIQVGSLILALLGADVTVVLKSELSR